MRTFTLTLLTALALAGAASAQQATEQFIPIGQSPGALTMQGQVTSSAAPAAAGGEGSVSMTSEAAPAGVSYVVGPNTRVYIDNSTHGHPNTLGSMADVQPGRAIEVSIPNLQTPVATWIKVRASE